MVMTTELLPPGETLDKPDTVGGPGGGTGQGAHVSSDGPHPRNKMIGLFQVLPGAVDGGQRGESLLVIPEHLLLEC